MEDYDLSWKEAVIASAFALGTVFSLHSSADKIFGANESKLEQKVRTEGREAKAVMARQYKSPKTDYSSLLKGYLKNKPRAPSVFKPFR